LKVTFCRLHTQFFDTVVTLFTILCWNSALIADPAGWH